MRALELRIVIMVVVMRTAPHAAGTHRIKTKTAHQPLCQSRVRQDRMMLLIVENDEHPQDQQPSQNAARHLSCNVNIPQASHQGRNQEKSRRNHMPPASDTGIVRKWFSREDQLSTASPRVSSGAGWLPGSVTLQFERGGYGRGCNFERSKCFDFLIGWHVILEAQPGSEERQKRAPHTSKASSRIQPPMRTARNYSRNIT